MIKIERRKFAGGKNTNSPIKRNIMSIINAISINK